MNGDARRLCFTRIRIPARRNYGGEGGIRTPGSALWHYDGLANRCFRPLSHLSVLNVPDFSALWSVSLHYTAPFDAFRVLAVGRHACAATAGSGKDVTNSALIVGSPARLQAASTIHGSL